MRGLSYSDYLREKLEKREGALLAALPTATPSALTLVPSIRKCDFAYANEIWGERVKTKKAFEGGRS